MIPLQIACLGIVGLWLVIALAHALRPGRLALQALVVAAAAWAAEDTCIRCYGFYAYDPSWGLFLDRVPLAVVGIWPALFLSDRALVTALWPRAGRLAPVLVGALVAADAALVEPVSVAAGLWAWAEPGLFGVPPVAILGWGLFGVLACALLDLAEARGRAWLGALPLLAPLGVHAGLLAAWWGLFRWISAPLPGPPAALAVWIASLALLVPARRAGHRVPAWQVFTRGPPGVFFLVLLVLHGRRHPDLVAWALAFTPPHLALLLARRPPGRPLSRDDPSTGA